ncbi:HlyD family secretion protein [Psychromonas sp. KJ10-2]|uniref:HlyD family secretion protein n=1 Tax=Psychromonas sp. KJ10-2 TaxID=3391822 RepID=UPI0039B36D5D
MIKKDISLLLLITSFFLTGCGTQDVNYAMGTVERDRIKLSAPASEKIVYINVHEGEIAHIGDVLIQLDASRANAMLSERRAELAQVISVLDALNKGTRIEQLNAAKAVLEETEADSQEAERQYKRISKLFKDKAVGIAEMDVAKTQRNTSKAKKQQAYEQWLELKNGARQEDLDQAEARVRAAKAALLWQQKAVDELTITSPVDGIVDSLPWNEGDFANAGAELVNVLANAKPFARVYLPASALTKIKAGGAIKVYVDGIKKPVEGKVRNIRSQPAYSPFYALNERDRSRLMYLTDIDLVNESDLPTGLAVEVHLP